MELLSAMVAYGRCQLIPLVKIRTNSFFLKKSLNKLSAQVSIH